MSILDTLYILFKGDASQLKREEQDVRRENSKTEQSFKQLDKTSNQINESFVNMGRSLAGLVAGLYSVSAVLGGFRNAVDYANNLGIASSALNVNAEALDDWGNAVRLTGGDVNSFKSSLQSLAQHLGTTGNVALKILPQLADSFHRLGNFRAMQFGKMLGLDESTILLLQRGRREVDEVLKRQKELGVVTKAQIEVSRKFNYELGNTGQAFRSLYLGVAETILPIFSKFLVVMQDVAIYFQSHTDFIVGALIAMGTAATGAAIYFGLLSLPILAVVAAIGLFALAYDDIETFFKGGDSIIGRYATKWKHWFDLIKQGFQELQDIWGKITGSGALNVSANFNKGFDLLGQASSTPLNTLASNSVFNAQNQNGNKIDIQSITINTQATDAEGIGTALVKNIHNYYAQANAQFDDGKVA
jgi:hypothetical protein